ncbi:hypothetical protein ABFU82_07460 [Nocardioides sp. WV_118_6]|uniref:hypothetical protein n=1 Tax=Nocardioides simplex TaxID=2045 RepID=UPI0021506531|nr:hypothetical protein [Pimelobacter simplex]UUW88235.1 hypothetical protein M0M43_21170 [Pimelobacter simplex]UUW97740.1 hypothetical protein M0M48_09815 [Pimelobacter simplex]
MSKLDALRAMREARFKQDQERAGKPSARVRPPVAPAAATPAAKPARASRGAAATEGGSETTEDEALCGHRNISGRTCTRERGHAAKTHRYS